MDSTLANEFSNEKPKSQVIDRCINAFEQCKDTGKNYELNFPGFVVKIQPNKYKSFDNKSKIEVVLIGGLAEIHYTPINTINLENFLIMKIRC